LWWYALAAISALTCLVPLPLAVRVSSFLWLVPLSFAGTASVPSGEAEITVLDVGQGASVVVQTSQHVLVFGTGDAYGSDGRVAEGTLVPFLRSRGVQQIDVLVLDRLGPVSAPGVSALLAEFPVRATLLGNDPPPDLPSARRCGAGGSWNWDGVSFRMLRPHGRVDGVVSTEPCPLLIESGRARVLIPGDIDAAMERQLLAAEPLSTDAVIVPRGGSNTASSAELVRAAGARWAIVSGQRMRDGKVRPAIRRWEQGGARVLATAELGAIRLRLHPVKGMENPQSELSTRAALWRMPAASTTEVAPAAHEPVNR
jgi:competence protein ComEC